MMAVNAPDGPRQRVLHVRSSAGFFGAERVITTLLDELPNHGVAPSLAVFENHVNGDQALLDRAGEQGLDVHELPCRGQISPGAVSALRRLAQDRRIDCIHTHDYKSHVHGLAAARQLGIPTVATLHGWISSDLRRRLYRSVERALLPLFEAVTVVSSEMAERLQQLRWWRPRRLLTVGNAVDTRRFSDRTAGFGRAHWGLDKDDFVFGVIGRLSDEKGQVLLIDAFAKIAAARSRVHLLLVGDGPDRDRLASRARELSLTDRIHLAGSQREVERALRDLDCYVSPSRTEGMPMVILEAMASGVPIIATRVGAIPDMLADGAGRLVPREDVLALAQAMAAAADGELDLGEMATRARDRCVQQYSVSAQADQFARIYQSICT